MSYNEFDHKEYLNLVRPKIDAHKKFHKDRYKKHKTTNLELSKNDPNFKDACALANTASTQRQASKFRSKKGLAYQAHKRGN